MENPFFKKQIVESSGAECGETLSPLALLLRRNLVSLVVGTITVIYFVQSHPLHVRPSAARQAAQPQPVAFNAPAGGTLKQGQNSHGQPALTAASLELASAQTRLAAEKIRLVSAQLKLEQSSLLQDIDHTQQLALQQVSDSRFQQAMLNGQLEQLADQIKIESAQMSMAQKLVNTWRPLLAKGYISTLQFEQEQSTVWGYESQYRALLQQQYGARQQLNVLNDQQLQIPLATSVKLNVLRRQLAQVDENLSQNETILQQALYMPSDGSVKSVIAKADNRMTGEQSSQAGEANSQQTATTRLISDKPVAGMHRDNPGGAHFQTINAQSGNSFNSGHHSVSAHNV